MPSRLHYHASVAAIATCFIFTVPAFASDKDNPAPTQSSALTSYTADPSALDDMRLETIGYRLSTANGSACDKATMRSGLLLHDQASYAAKDRELAIHKYDLTYGFGVLGVVPGSVAETAGLMPKDEILALNGLDLATYYPELMIPSGTFDRVGSFIDTLEAALEMGPASLTIKRSGHRMTINLTGVLGCGGYVQLVKSGNLNAWSDGSNVAITTHMLEYTDTDDELAFVIAHEMSHNILHHAPKLKNRSQMLASLGLGAGSFRKAEDEADRLAVHLIHNTDYDPKGPERLLARLHGSVLLLLLATDFSHPSLGHRLAAVRLAAAEESARPKAIFANAQLPAPGFISISRNATTAPIRLALLETGLPKVVPFNLEEQIKMKPAPAGLSNYLAYASGQSIWQHADLNAPAAKSIALLNKEQEAPKVPPVSIGYKLGFLPAPANLKPAD